jgi:uncharacterized membrane protein
MIRYDSSIRINRPADEVFARLSAVERMADWTDMSNGRWLGEGVAIGAGSRAEATIHLGPISRHLTWEVTTYEPGRRVGYRTLPGSAIDWTAEYTLEADATGTTVRQAGEVGLHGLLRVLEPLVRMELPKGESRELTRLKAVLEPPAGARASA